MDRQDDSYTTNRLREITIDNRVSINRLREITIDNRVSINRLREIPIDNRVSINRLRRKMDRQDDSYTTHKDKFLFSSHTFNF
jgi:hypothetical protein